MKTSVCVLGMFIELIFQVFDTKKLVGNTILCNGIRVSMCLVGVINFLLTQKLQNSALCGGRGRVNCTVCVYCESVCWAEGFLVFDINPRIT